MKPEALFILSAFLLIITNGCATKTETAASTDVLRVAVFNIQELKSEELKEVDVNGVGQNLQAIAAAEIIHRVNPDVLIINEIDHDYSVYDGTNESLESNLKLFNQNYLQTAGLAPYRYFFAAPNNTGQLSGYDFNNDGKIATQLDVGTRDHGNDSWGYGDYRGQYSMGIMSRYPLDKNAARTFQEFKWKDMPNSHIPKRWYSFREQSDFRLSSKSHWDVPVIIGEEPIHLFVSHPTPPVFDGDEDRNGRRNFDEVRFWVEYINNSEAIWDDNRITGGFQSDAPFIIAGDLNASKKSDPIYTGEIAINTLLDHPRIHDPNDLLVSNGGLNGRESGPPNNWENATATFMDGYRADYLLPSKNLKLINGGVFWPSEIEDPEGARLADEASDHRLLWLDIEL